MYSIDIDTIQVGEGKYPNAPMLDPSLDMITQDVVVLAWIYATISPYLLARLLTKKCTTAIDAWARLRDMCQQHDTAMQKKRRMIVLI